VTKASTTEQPKAARQTPVRIGPNLTRLIEGKDSRRFQRLGDNLYRRSNGGLYCRATVNGKRRWHKLDVEETKNARKLIREWRDEEVLKARGIELPNSVLERHRLTAGQIVSAYIAAGFPTRKMRQKADTTIESERHFLKPIVAYFGAMPAAKLTVGECDKYRDWRNRGRYVTTRKQRDGSRRPIRTRGGDRGVDMELGVLTNALNLSVRSGLLKANPLAGRGRYTTAEDIRHCREVAPTPEGLQQIVAWLRERNEPDVADAVSLMAYSGLRIGEALLLQWEAVNWSEGLLQVQREKKGVNPWVAILPEMEALLRNMQARAINHLLFPSPFDPAAPRDQSAIRRRLAAACKALGIGHVTPHGLRSYFVTQARQSGLTDAEIAMLIGDKTGPAIISQTYGDVRPDHLLAQARRIRLWASGRDVSNAELREH
jgi:integrase